VDLTGWSKHNLLSYNLFICLNNYQIVIYYANSSHVYEGDGEVELLQLLAILIIASVLMMEMIFKKWGAWELFRFLIKEITIVKSYEQKL